MINIIAENKFNVFYYRCQCVRSHATCSVFEVYAHIRIQILNITVPKWKSFLDSSISVQLYSSVSHEVFPITYRFLVTDLHYPMLQVPLLFFFHFSMLLKIHFLWFSLLTTTQILISRVFLFFLFFISLCCQYVIIRLANILFLGFGPCCFIFYILAYKDFDFLCAFTEVRSVQKFF